MLRTTNKELLLQISILFVCTFTLLFNFAQVDVQAQVFCDGVPPLLEPLAPKTRAFAQGQNVSVVIFNTPDSAEFSAIFDGIRLWNPKSVESCSGVTYNVATPGNGTPPANPASGTIQVERPTTPIGQMVGFFSPPGDPFPRLLAGRVLLSSDVGVTAPPQINSSNTHGGGLEV